MAKQKIWVEMHGRKEYSWEVSISREALLKALRTIENFPPDCPDDAEIFVRVPGGADWSNENLEISDNDRASFLKVKFSTTTIMKYPD